MSSVNSQIRGGPNNAFTNVADSGHLDTQSAFKQFTSPVPIRFPTVANIAVQLENIPCAYVTIQNPIENDPIRVGGLDDQTPYIDKTYTGDSRGTIVYPGMSMDFDVVNANLLQVVGTPQQMFYYHAYPNVTTQVRTNTQGPPPPIDLSIPTVVSTNPANGATNVSTSIAPTATLSKPIDPSTVNLTTVTISPSITYTAMVSGTNPNQISIQPSASLATSTTYTITLTTGITDTTPAPHPEIPLGSNYSWSFTTAAAPDTTPPTVSSTNPAAGATNVAIAVNPTITFSEGMASSTINATNVLLLDNTLATVPSTVSLSSDKLTATITPTSSLSNSITYTIRVLVAVTDIAGNHLASQFNSTFTTIAATPPTVTSISPANNATSVSLSTTIVLTFSQSLQGSSIDNSTSTGQTNIQVLDNTGTNINAFPTSFENGSNSNTTVTITPQSPLKYSTKYTVKVSGVKNTNGVAMVGTNTYVFTTVAPTYTQIFNNAGQTSSHAILHSTANAQQWGLYVNSSSSQMQNKIPRKVIVPMSKVGSPTGTIYLRMINDTYQMGDSRQVVYTIGSIDISTLTTADLNYTFEDPTNNTKLDVLTAAGLVVEFTGGNTSNYLRIERDGNAAYDGGNTIVVYTAGGSYQYDTSRDFAGTVYT